MSKVVILFAILIGVFGGAVNASLIRQQEYPKYKCQKQGMFPHPESSDCAAFILCDSKLKAFTQICPTDTYFWPSKNGCFSYYNCSTGSSKDGTNPCDGFSGDYVRNKLSNDCSSYVACSTQTVSNSDYSEEYRNTYAKLIACPNGTTFRQDWQICDSVNRCSNYQCVKEGYFSNPNTKDCSSFVECSKFLSHTGNTLLYPTLVNCPENTLFSPFSKKCDAYYTCGGQDVWKGNYPCLNYNWAVPGVPNPLDKKCATYLSCQHYILELHRTIDVIEKAECPPNTLFSPNIGKCYENYECNETNNSCSKDPCGNGVGRFVDYKSGGCDSFIECRNDAGQIYEPTYARRYCPPGMRFSPKIGKCDRNYVCPTFPVNYCYPTITTTAPPRPLQAPASAAAHPPL